MFSPLVFGLSLSLIGCGDSTSEEIPKLPEPKKRSEKVPGDTPRDIPAKKTPVPKQPTADKKGFDPLEGKSLKEICSANGLLLIKWPYDKIQSEFKALCCADGGLESDHYQCEMDWPFSDVPSCSAYDELRNEIFARYGRSFKTAKWQKQFGATDWYSVRTDFSNDWLSDVANQNVAQLVKNKKEKVSCMD